MTADGAADTVFDRWLPRYRMVLSRARRSGLVAATLEMAVRGEARVTVRDIADRAELSVSTVYKLFRSKDQLLCTAAVALLARHLGDPARLLAGATDTEARLTRIVDVLLLGTWRYRDLAIAMSDAGRPVDDGACEEFADIRDRLADVFARCVADGPVTRRDHAIGELIFDVWSTNVSALINDRADEQTVRRRVVSAGVLLSRSSG